MRSDSREALFERQWDSYLAAVVVIISFDCYSEQWTESGPELLSDHVTGRAPTFAASLCPKWTVCAVELS